MNSLKNSVVAILLLGVSFGVYQVITTPDGFDNRHSTAASSLDIVYEPKSEAAVERAEPGVEPNKPVENRMSAPPKPFGGNVASQPDSFVDQPSSQPVASNTKPSPPPAFIGKDGAEMPSTTQMAPLNVAEIPPSRPAMAPNDTFVPQNNPAAANVRRFDGGNNSDFVASMPATTQPETTQPLEALQPSREVTLGSRRDVEVSTAPTAESIWNDGVAQARGQQFRDALETMTALSKHPQMPREHENNLMEWLDTLAAKVIYSGEHHFAGQPYIIRPGDTLESIARQWRVPVQLIYNINRNSIPVPDALEPGTPLKQIEGPFRAKIDLTSGILTLFTHDCYAGRFYIQKGDWSQIPTGESTIKLKELRGHAAGDLAIELDTGIVMCFSPTAGHAAKNVLTFNEKDARDLFSILSMGSEIRLLR